MDEPTASLSDRRSSNLFRVIRELKAQGVGIIYISHRLEELPRVADRVTALRDGALVGTRPMAEVDRAELIRMMVGRELSAVFPKVEVADRARSCWRSRGSGCRASGVHDVELRGPRGRDPRPGRAGRRGADRAGPRPVRPDAGRLGRRSCCDGEPVAIDSPGAGGRAGDRLRPRGPPAARGDPGDVGRGEHDPGDPPRGLDARPARLPPASARSRPTRRAARGQDGVDRRAGRQPLGRQPAEGGAGPLAGGRARRS